MPVPDKAVRPAYRLYRWAWAGLDWIFPPRCGGCGCPGTRWCPDCRQKIREIGALVCPHCGKGQASFVLCPRCRAGSSNLAAVRSWAIFGGPLRQALHRLKYKGDVALGDILAEPLLVLLRELDWPVEVITAVPLGVARQKERGYNQANLLACPLALASGKMYRPRALAKVRETRSQVGLTAEQRRENVADAFQARPRDVAGRRVLVVDDVFTTGATLEACAAALLQAGAAQVYGLTLARADQPGAAAAHFSQGSRGDFL